MIGAQIMSALPSFWINFEQAWNTHNAASVAACFEDTGSLEFYDGRVFSGRAAIEAFYREVFGNMPKNWVHRTIHAIDIVPALHIGSVAIKYGEDDTALMELRFVTQSSQDGAICTLSLRKKTPFIHLLHGLPGTGKSTFARQLAHKTGAVCLNHDEWMIALYGNNPPAEHFADYHDRVLNLIWEMAAEFARRGIDVILDHGFWTRMARDQARMKSVEIGVAFLFYAMVCPPEVADSRVLHRNRTLGKSALYIDQAALNLFRKRYEPIGADESCLSVSMHH